MITKSFQSILKSTNKIKIILILNLLFLVSCVGTIQDSAKKNTDAVIQKPVTINFLGIDHATAVAHNRIEIYFKPASGGSGNFSYLIYKDGNLVTPVASVSQSELTLDKNGNYSVAVSTGLVIGTRYTFLARAFDPGFNVQDANNVQVSVQTLNFKTPIFDGVQTVENLSGKEGEKSLNVIWNVATPASTSGGIFSGNVDTISGYNIYVGESEESMTLYTTVSGATTTTTKLSNLDSGKLYYIRVRARNSDSTPVEDLNEKFIAKKTLTNIPISFAGVTAVTIPSSSAGFSNIEVKWAIGAGNYDRYKIFASSSPVSSYNPILTDNLVDTITDLSILSRTINVNGPNTVWYVSVVACNDSTCTESKGQNIIKFVKTSPPIAAFNGIKTIAQPIGGEGLSALDLTWDLPDNNSGVYDEIRIFKSNASGHFDPFTDRIDNLSYDSNNPSVTGVTLKTSESVRVNGLATGVEACFVAKAYSTSPFDASNPDGRTGVTLVVKCATPNYIVPGFAGVKSGCLNRTAEAFKVSWNAPNPVGTYEDYEVYYKEGSSGFDINAALAGDAAYTKKSVLSLNLNYTLSNLKLDTSYQILVKTHFLNPVNSTHYRDNNSIILTCTTTGLSVAQGPWFELFAIGPKYNAIKMSFVTEKLTPVSGDSVNTSWKHQFPFEDNTGSANGIVRIAWEDMILSNGLKLKNYYATPNTGYKVYRMNYNPIYGAAGPTYNDSSWGAPINSDYIQAPATDYILYDRANPNGYTEKIVAQFVDYTLEHPYNDNISRANEGTVYWYKIEAWYNGKKLPLENIASDAVVRMILPPKNMTLVHRWMSNKQICEDMSLSIDRSNNYKCQYTGMGAVLDPNDGQYYYDMKGDLLVDRFKMGCNFTRGINACSVAPGQTAAGFDGAASAPARGIVKGDCISGSSMTASESEPFNRILAARGSVFFNRLRNRCYVNTSSTPTGTKWSAISDLNQDNNTGAEVNFPFYSYKDITGPTKYSYDQDNIGPGSTKIPPLSAKYPSGLNYGAAYSNDAQLPHMNRFTDPVSLYYMCQSSSVKINSNNYDKRLARRKEIIAYKAESPLLDKTVRLNLESGYAEAPPTNIGVDTLVDRDCERNSTSRSYLSYYRAHKYSTVGVAAADLYHNWYPNTFEGTVSGMYYLADALVTGSAVNSKNTKSTEACTSRFGVQDYVGGIAESSTDQFYCNHNDQPYGCFTGHKNYNKSAPFVPIIDPENKENYKNANGEYYFSLHTSSIGSFDSLGVRIINNTHSLGSNYNLLIDFFCINGAGEQSYSCAGLPLIESARYFNLAMGLPMLCEGETCKFGGSDDSNSLVTARTNAPSPNTIVTSFDKSGGNESVSNMRYSYSDFAPGSLNTIRSIYSGSERSYDEQNSRYTALIGSNSLQGYSGGRCVLLLPENY